jgi:hypothetical protein
VTRGGAAFHAVRGEYGSGKTFFARWLGERAKRRGLAVSEIQISETETPLHRLETVYRRLTERLTTATHQPSALRAVVDSWLLPHLETYTAWLGRRVALWHGDVSQPARQRVMRDPPDILLTTPESLESMLVSMKVEQAQLFAGLRAIVVDEVHAFAGDDRGWHLLAVLERLTRLAGRPIQRVGLSATVGNPAELLAWLQGAGRDTRRHGSLLNRRDTQL